MNTPQGVVAGAGAVVYEADTGYDRVQKYDELPVPARITTWGRLKRNIPR